MSKGYRGYRAVSVGRAGRRFTGTPHVSAGEGRLPLRASTMAIIAAMAAKTKSPNASPEKAWQEIPAKLVLDGCAPATSGPIDGSRGLTDDRCLGK